MTDRKIKLDFTKLGPIIKKGELENTGITLLYGFPNTGKSFILRSLYSVLSFCDKEMLKDINTYVKHNVSSLVENIFDQMLHTSISKLSKLPEIYEIINFASTNKKINTDYNNIALDLLNSVCSSSDLQYKSELTETEILFNFEEKVDLGFGISKLNEVLESSLEEFLYLIVGNEVLTNLSLNDKNFKDLVDHELTNINFNIGMSSIQIPPNIFRSNFREHYNEKTYLRDMNYELIDLSEKKGTLRINLTIAFELSSQKKILDYISSSPDVLNKQSEKEIAILKKAIITEMEKKESRRNFPPSYAFRIIPRLLSEAFSTTIVDSFLEHLKTMVENVSSVKEVRFIPFGRTPLIHIKTTPLDLRYKIGGSSDYLDPSLSIFKVFQRWINSTQIMLPNMNKIGHRGLDTSILLQGKISFDETTSNLYYTDSRNNTIDIKYASAMANEVSGLILSYYSLGSNGMIIMEEPEAQLHPVSQIIMALSLVALSSFGIRLIFSTHSDIFGQIFYFLSKYKPSVEQIDELINEVTGDTLHSNANKNKTSELAKQVSKALEMTSFNAYFLDYGGKVSPIEINSLGKEIPGITDQALITLLNWTVRISENITED
ncbi:MAG: ATP-binding protein [Thermoplasmataceae archaeon]